MQFTNLSMTYLSVLLLTGCACLSAPSKKMVDIERVGGEMTTQSNIHVTFRYNVAKPSYIFIRPTCGHSSYICGEGRDSAEYVGEGEETTFIYLTEPQVVTGLKYTVQEIASKEVVAVGQIPVNLPITAKEQE
ncbi:hypothetical protein BOO24_16275 [Vibrio navarrensis]|uniref:hypothetical protein n=1 Tax=Vibrio TaxID=662 RepID=UPI0005EE3E9E|nr:MULTISPECIES: hypothetical protein [Vibrio]KJR30107.1 hypothetical protein UF06_09705 [Vibrio sp. S234-5]MBE4593890.1 hypothetical protein [Vibrio navarrensis]